MNLGHIISPPQWTSCYLLCGGWHTSHLWADGPLWVIRGAREVDRVESTGWAGGHMQHGGQA